MGTKLATVADVVMGQSPPGTTYNQEGIGLPFFQGVTDFGYRFPTPRIFCSAPTRIAEPGDILVSVRAPIGRVNVASEKCATGRGVAIVRPHRPEDARYLEFELRLQEHYWQTLESAGSVFGNATRKDLDDLLLSWNDDAIARVRIGEILGKLDDRIELNRRMSATLEETARAIFKSWFIDFDPVHAKAEGRPTNLPSEIDALFPDSFQDSDLGQIPTGWRVGCVDDDFKLTMGQSPPGNTYNFDGVGLPFYQGRSDFGFRFPTRRVYCTSPTRLAEPGDTLISVRAPVGDINMSKEPCAIGRGVAAARHQTNSRSFTYYFMRSIENVFETFESEGTVFGSIGKKEFHAIKCVLAPRNLVEHFESQVGPIDEQICILVSESMNLAAIRDALLPKLISGELTVANHEESSMGVLV